MTKLDKAYNAIRDQVYQILKLSDNKNVDCANLTISPRMGGDFVNVELSYTYIDKDDKESDV